ncbi:MAG: hypothetical protein N4A54_00560 [Peptostreptococcaceae bacterium]|nr:hypothetical protein [Peptostreptococcaceae bacterium]
MPNIKYLNLFNLSYFYNKKKNYNMAIEMLNKIIDNTSNTKIKSKSLILLASVYTNAGELKKTKNILKFIKNNLIILKYIKNNTILYNSYNLQYAQIHLEKKQYYQCRKYYKVILESEINTNYKTKILIYIANTYQKENKLKSYIRYLNKALDIYLKHKNKKKSLKLLFLIGKTHFDLLNIKKAQENISKAIKLDIESNFRYTNMNIYYLDIQLNITQSFEKINFFKLILNMKFFNSNNLNTLNKIYNFLISYYKKNNLNNLIRLSSLIKKILINNKNTLLSSILKEKFSEIMIHLINLNKIEFIL